MYLQTVEYIMRHREQDHHPVNSIQTDYTTAGLN